jgi:ABC-2 type transport system permease protein
LLQKEWLTLRRDPQRLVQMAYPLIIVGFYAYRVLGARSSFGSGISSGTTGFFDVSLYIMLTFTSILVLSSIAPPIVNREGRSLYILALSPLSPRIILLSKWVICVIPVLAIAEVLLVVGALILQIEPVRALVTAFALVALIIALAGLVISINLIWPRLDSDNPRRQVSGIATGVSLVSEFIIGSFFCLLLILTFNLWPHLPLISVAAGLSLVLLTGAITGTTSIVGPRLLQNLLTRG